MSVRNGAARTLSSRSTYDEDEASGGYGSVRSQVLVWGILAVNGVVFVAWYMAKNSWVRIRTPHGSIGTPLKSIPAATRAKLETDRIHVCPLHLESI